MPDRRELGPTIGLSIAFILLALGFIGAMGALVTPILARLLVPLHAYLLADSIGNLLGVGAATMVLVRSIDPRPWSDIDAGDVAFRWRALARGALFGAIPIAVVCAVLLAIRLMHFENAAAGSTWLAAAGRVTIVLLVAALFEELLLRGYLLTVLKDGLGTRGGTIVTSVIFSAIHLANPNVTASSLMVVLLSGFALAAVRLALKSVYAAWMAHFAWNWVMAVPFHALVSGVSFESPGYRSVTSDAAWLSGGYWGPEGGALAAASLAAGLFIYQSRRSREESQE